MEKQISMFTSEQMSGSGQTNMLDLIQANEERKRELRTLPHTFWSDPGHGWLEVRFSDLIILDLLGVISGYSYRDGDKVYLEEDSDASRYIKALFGSNLPTPEFEIWRNLIKNQERDPIFIRKLKHYKV